jgi:hypothetical protein
MIYTVCRGDLNDGPCPARASPTVTTTPMIVAFALSHRITISFDPENVVGLCRMIDVVLVYEHFVYDVLARRRTDCQASAFRSLIQRINTVQRLIFSTTIYRSTIGNKRMAVTILNLFHMNN